MPNCKVAGVEFESEKPGYGEIHAHGVADGGSVLISRVAGLVAYKESKGDLYGRKRENELDGPASAGVAGR